MNNEVLVLKDIWKIYKTPTGDFPVLKGINLSIKESELAVIMGPSGSGKTTLLSIAGGLDKPTKGRVIIGGIDITDMDEEELTKIRARKIGFVFQSYNLIRNFTALENVMAPLLFTGIYSREEAKIIAEKTLKLVGLERHLNKYPNQLSGGQQQRVAIARAIAPGPDIILMDEPTGNLDVGTSVKILSLIKWLNEIFDQTFIIVTHNPEISELASTTYYIRGGRIYKEPPRTTLAETIKELKKKKETEEQKTVQIEILKARLEALKKAVKNGKIDLEIAKKEINALEEKIEKITAHISKAR